MPLRSALVSAALAGLGFAPPASAFNDSAGDDRVAFPPSLDDRVVAVDAGDVDGDGVGDVATSFMGREGSRVRVVFGRRHGGDTGPGDLAERGYVIEDAVGPARPAGDVDRDGRPDLAVPYDGGVSVVFGRAATGSVSATAPGPHRLLLTGAQGGDAVAMGDLDGNGSADLAVNDGDRSLVRIVYTPAAPRGATVDAGEAGPHAGVLRLPEGGDWWRMAAIGDADGNGGRELVLSKDGDPRVFGVRPPRAGQDAPVEREVAEGRAFVLRSAARVEAVVAAGDQDFDGGEDIALAVRRERGMDAVLVDPPAFGTTEELGAASLGRLQNVESDLHAVGDQDGDGRPDFAWGAHVVFTGGEEHVRFDDGDHYKTPGAELTVAAATRDRDGDGRPELVILERVPDGDGAKRTFYGVNSTGRVLEHQSDAPPLHLGDRIRYTATWAHGPHSRGTGPLRASPMVQVRRAGGTIDTTWGRSWADVSGRGPFELSIEADLVRGYPTEYRVGLYQPNRRPVYGPWRPVAPPAPVAVVPPGALPVSPRARRIAVSKLPRAARRAGTSWVLRGTAAGVRRASISIKKLGRRARKARARTRIVAVRAGRWQLRVRGLRPGRYEVRSSVAGPAGHRLRRFTVR